MKNYSLIAILSFGIGIFCWVAYFIQLGCLGEIFIPEVAFLIGLVALIHIKKKGLKGKWFAILGIILGALGSLILVCL